MVYEVTANSQVLSIIQGAFDLTLDPEKVRYKVIGVEMKGMESSMKLVALGATQRRG